LAEDSVTRSQPAKANRRASEWHWGPPLSKGFVAVALVVLLFGGFALAYIFEQRVQASTEWKRQVELANAEAERIRQSIVAPTGQPVPAGRNFAAALQNLGLTQQDAGGSACLHPIPCLRKIFRSARPYAKNGSLS